MNIMLIGFVVVIGLGLLPLALDIWQRMTPKTRLLVLLVAALAFMLLACGNTTCEGNTWCLDNSTDLTGVIWRALP